MTAIIEHDCTQGHGKVCAKCGELKPTDDYYKRTRKSGHIYVNSSCITCTKTINEARRQENIEHDLEKKRDYARRNSAAVVERVRRWRALPGNTERKNEGERRRRKNPEVAAQNAEYNKAWLSIPGNRERLNSRERERRKQDPEYRARLLTAQREYYSRPYVKAMVSAKGKEVKTTQEWKDRFNARRRERYASDPVYACQISISRMVGSILRKTRRQKQDRSHVILGYSAHQLRQRLECQFLPGMSWENRSEWHIDHKKPVAEFLRQGITDPRTINMLCNLQPLWGEDNQAKSDKWSSLLVACDNDNDMEKRSDAA